MLCICVPLKLLKEPHCISKLIILTQVRLYYSQFDILFIDISIKLIKEPHCFKRLHILNVGSSGTRLIAYLPGSDINKSHMAMCRPAF